jgi:hypothetical protein
MGLPLLDLTTKNIFKKYIKEAKRERKHALYSASGSERWLGCPGSVRLNRDIPTIDNEWSVTGTHAHTLLQFILENPFSWKSNLDRREAKAFKEHISFSEEQLLSVMLAAEYIWKEVSRMEDRYGKPPIFHIEETIELEGVGFGTADIILYHPFGALHVMDYKNGRSPVEAVENTQALYYAHGAADRYGWDFKEILITIIQPNATHRDGPIRTWRTTPKRLEKAGKRFIDGVKASKKKDAPLVVNQKWCWFCNARPTCPAHLKVKERAVVKRFMRD